MRTSLALIVCGLLALPAAGQESAPPSPPGSPEANKTVVRRYLEEVLTAGRFALLDELISPDFVDRTPGSPAEGRGPEVIRESQRRARQLFENVRYTVDDLVAEGDRVAARYTVRATRKATGEDAAKPIEVIGITMFRLADGKIQEAWIVNDQIELFRQLGFILTPAPKEPPKPKAPPEPPPQPAG
jgi:ketosteroid isomerase-like protein